MTGILYLFSFKPSNFQKITKCRQTPGIEVKRLLLTLTQKCIKKPLYLGLMYLMYSDLFIY